MPRRAVVAILQLYNENICKRCGANVLRDFTLEQSSIFATVSQLRKTAELKNENKNRSGFEYVFRDFFFLLTTKVRDEISHDVFMYCTNMIWFFMTTYIYSKYKVCTTITSKAGTLLDED